MALPIETATVDINQIENISAGAHRTLRSNTIAVLNNLFLKYQAELLAGSSNVVSHAARALFSGTSHATEFAKLENERKIQRQAILLITLEGKETAIRSVEEKLTRMGAANYPSNAKAKASQEMKLLEAILASLKSIDQSTKKNGATPWGVNQNSCPIGLNSAKTSTDVAAAIAFLAKEFEALDSRAKENGVKSHSGTLRKILHGDETFPGLLATAQKVCTNEVKTNERTITETENGLQTDLNNLKGEILTSIEECQDGLNESLKALNEKIDYECLSPNEEFLKPFFELKALLTDLSYTFNLAHENISAAVDPSILVDCLERIQVEPNKVIVSLVTPSATEEEGSIPENFPQLIEDAEVAIKALDTIMMDPKKNLLQQSQDLNTKWEKHQKSVLQYESDSQSTSPSASRQIRQP